MTPSMTSGISRCPYCGDERTWCRKETDGHRVVCDGCRARGEQRDEPEAAVLSWNRVARMPAQLEETRRALQVLADRMHPGVA